MKTTRRRYWVFFLLFLFNLIAYVDRVNMSVAGQADRAGIRLVAGGARVLVLLLPVGLCADDAAGRAADRPLGRACRRVGRDGGVVGGADGDRRGLELCGDAGDAAGARDRRGPVRAGYLPQRARLGALYRAGHRNRRHFGRLQLGAGARRAVCGVADRGGVVALVVHHHRRDRVRLGRALVGRRIDAGKDAVAAACGAAADFCRA